MPRLRKPTIQKPYMRERPRVNDLRRPCVSAAVCQPPGLRAGIMRPSKKRILAADTVHLHRHGRLNACTRMPSQSTVNLRKGRNRSRSRARVSAHRPTSARLVSHRRGLRRAPARVPGRRAEARWAPPPARPPAAARAAAPPRGPAASLEASERRARRIISLEGRVSVLLLLLHAIADRVFVCLCPIDAGSGAIVFLLAVNDRSME